MRIKNNKQNSGYSEMAIKLLNMCPKLCVKDGGVYIRIPQVINKDGNIETKNGIQKSIGEYGNAESPNGRRTFS